jgi:hypothetical protein
MPNHRPCISKQEAAQGTCVYACILRMIERAHGDADSRSSSMQKKKKSVPALTAVHCMQGEAGGVAFAYGSEQERRGEERDGRVTTGGEEGKRDAGWPRCRGRCAISFLYLLPPLPYNKARGASLYIACFACPDHICIPATANRFSEKPARLASPHAYRRRPLPPWLARSASSVSVGGGCPGYLFIR